MEIVRQRAGEFEYTADESARQAGKNIYGTSVGMLRRTELWRLGNEWGMTFPSGASKDFMLGFFIRLEAEGKNPFRPPSGRNLDEIVKGHEVQHSEVVMSEFVPEPEAEPVSEPEAEPIVKPAPKNQFEQQLEKIHMGKLRKLCKARGIPISIYDRKQDLIARIVAIVEGNSTIVENPPERSE